MLKKVLSLTIVIILLAMTGCGMKNTIDKNTVKNESGDSAAIEIEDKDFRNKNLPHVVFPLPTPVEGTKTEVIQEPVPEVMEDIASETEKSPDSDIKQEQISDEAPESSSEKREEIVQEEHIHNWIPVTETIPHAEEGHWETKVIKEAWTEEIKGWVTRCSVCQLDMTNFSDDELTEHVAFVCGGRYSTNYEVINTIPHEAETEDVWVVDKAAYVETVTTGYICGCGFTK